ncbi:MAG: RAD55 family ATPase [Halodesulfurarchaeum sp.]
MPEKRSTGVEVLDRELDGGLPAGSVVAFQAPAASQGELLLYELTQPRPTLYLTGDRTEDAVADAIAATNAPTGDPEIRLFSGEDPLDRTRRAVREAYEGMTVIIDPVSPLERAEPGRYERLLNEIRNHMHNTGGIAFLHALDGPNPPPLRETTQHMADVVLSLAVSIKSGEIESRLAVQKYRGGRIPGETIKLDLAERVRVDTSRDIA